ncbi:amino acid adenylation domain-containing protein, partial [Chitinophaga sp. 30R24]|uniref:non-ribosomal peptide synthetase n=1 Tax=Chitinophaga sp. 30R24 TaxID=3248838 RepID=UPI003B91D618
MNKNENIQQIYPLTPMQEAMLFHTVYESSNAYFCQTHFRTRGQLDTAALQYSLEYLTQRHDILRTAFVHQQADRPLQIVLKSRKPSFQVLDFSLLPEEEREQAIHDFRQADMDKGFDLIKQPLLRLSLLQVGNGQYEFIWSFHHIIMDGWCLPVLINELKTIYHGHLHQQPFTLPEPVPFDRYVQWLGRQDQRASLDYWEQYLKGYNNLAVIPPVTLPDRSAALPPFQTAGITFGEEMVKSMNALVKKEGVTLNAFFQSVWGILLAGYNQTSDVVFGNVVAGRPAELPGVESMLGLFINTIPQRVHFNTETTFRTLLRQLHHDFTEHLPHQYCALPEIQTRSALGTSLLHHVFVFENYPALDKSALPADDPLQGEEIATVDVTNYEFDVEVAASETVDVHINYRTRTYEESYVKGILRQFEFLIQQVLADPGILVVDLELTDPAERTRQFTVFNNGAVELNNSQTIPHCFEAQVLKTGEQTAIIHGNTAVTYQTLNTSSNKIAALLNSLSLQKGALVGVYLPRTPELVACIMAILKAGAVYIPLDSQHLPVRIWDLINNNGIEVLITNSSLLDVSLAHAGEAAALKAVICTDTLKSAVRDNAQRWLDQSDITASPAQNPEIAIALHDPAYVLFTSGSTGMPKGAITLHKGAMNHILAELAALELKPGFRFLQSASIASDVSVWQMLAPLMNGGVVVIIDKEELLDYGTTLQLLASEAINIVEWVPSYLAGLLDYIAQNPQQPPLPHLQWVMMTGEELPVSLVNRWMELFPHSKMLNAYGPCEASDDIAQYVITAPLYHFSKVPIGKPIANMNILVLNKEGKLLPTGVPGELCVSGDGVGSGYLHDPVKTAAQFRKNTFTGILGDTYYRTGDLARWLPDGNLEFLGRIDLQVKIRGQRVELEEIENCFRLHPAINDAVVVLQPLQEELLPVAYLVPKTATDIRQLEDSLRSFVRQRLEAHMRPVAYVFMNAYPLNLSDKVDRKALPLPDLTDTKKDLTLPANEEETILLSIWQKILGKTAISTNDSFFEIGGHSLSATRLAIQINKQLKTNILLRTIFNYPTIQELAQQIRQGIAAEVKIPLLPVQSHYPLSHAQQRIWLSCQLAGEQFNYNMPDAYRFSGSFQPAIFSAAFHALTDRHEILRTGFIVVDGEPRQVIHPVSSLPGITFIDLQNSPHPDEAAVSLIQQLVTTVFDFEKPPLFKAVVIQTGADSWVFGFIIHHIITDGWSSDILLRDLLTTYNLLLGNAVPPLKPLSVQYKEYASWHKGKMQEKEIAVHRNYWLQQFQEGAPALELPLDFPRRSDRSQDGANVTIPVSADLLAKAKALSGKEEASLFMLLTAAVKVLLYRYTHQEDIIIGVPSAGREHNELEEQVGFYVNMLALKTKLCSTDSFRTFFRQVRKVALDAYEHQVYPFDQLVDDLKIIRDAGRMPLFDVMLVVQDTDDGAALAALSGDLEISTLPLESVSSKFDLLFEFEDKKEGMLLNIEYSTSLFKAARIERMGNHLINILTAIVADADQQLGALSYLGADELEEIFRYAGDHTKEAADKTVPLLLSEVVAAHPLLPALSDGKVTYNYAEVWAQSGHVVGYLQQVYNVRPEVLVGIVMGRGNEFVLSMLGVLRSGAAYLPIESRQPAERIRRLLHAGGVSVVLTDNEDIQNVLQDEFNCILFRDIINAGMRAAEVRITGDSLAYVMFTSGSTGEPKGVMVPHKGIVRLVRDTNYISFDASDRVLQTASLSFDVTTFEIWGPLLHGGMVYMTSLESLLDAEILREQIVRYGITKMWFTSSWFNQLADHNPGLFRGLQQVLVGGEQLSASHVSKVLTHCAGLRLTNGYGPTENTTFSACGDVTADDIANGGIRLGYPISKSLVYIVDEDLHLVPKGVNGELLLGGEGVSSGYLNDAERTAKSFINSPFVPGEILYRSGDIGCWDEDGRIIFRGRKDNQVKIRGYRVEPLEIALVMKGYPYVQDAVVKVLTGSNGEKQLAAYYTGKEGIEVSLKSYLKEQLPAYMVPAYFSWLTQMPLNKNGKLDTSALPDITTGTSAQVVVVPQNEWESLLLGIWEELLGRKNISTTDHFFEIGANSLTAVRLGYKIKELTGIKLELSTVFKYPDIQSLAKLLSAETAGQQRIAIPVRTSGDTAPLSFSQERLWFIDQLQGSTHYHIPALLRLKGALNKAALKYALDTIIARHEVLRTVFREEGGIAYQQIQETTIGDIETVNNYQEDDSLEVAISALISQPFNLSEDIPFRVRLFGLSEDEYLLVIVMHHIASDGSSVPVLIAELSELYLSQLEQRPAVLPALGIQYADYASWERLQQDEQLGDDIAFWKEQLAGVPALEMPTDYLRPAMPGTEGDLVSITLPEGLTQQLEALAKQEGVTMYMLLLTVFNVLLYRYSHQEDICVGMPVAGRNNTALEPLIGFFVNTLALRTDLSGNPGFHKLLQRVKEHTIAAYSHQSAPFEQVVEAIGAPRDISRHPVFQVMFAFQSLKKSAAIQLGDVVITEEPLPHYTSKFDLNVEVEQSTTISISIEYNTRLYKAATIMGMAEHYQLLLQAVCDAPQQEIGKLNMLSAAAQTTILHTFNDTGRDYPATTILELFREQVVKTPAAVAVQIDTHQLTYAGLEEKSGRLAAYLLSKTGGKETIIAVLLERSLELMITLWGILKAGAAYVPIDPAYPEERIRYILEDTNASLLISTASLLSDQEVLPSVEILDINEYDFSLEPLSVNVSANDLAYLIYTSGSTGKPKGVMIEHGSLANRLLWAQEYFRLDVNDSVLQKTTYCFDVSVWELFWPSLAGARLVLAKPEGHKDAVYLKELINSAGITLLHFVPSMLEVFLESIHSGDCPGLQQVLCSGEALKPEQVHLFNTKLPHTRLHNLYGPTEAAIDVSYWTMSGDAVIVPIGKPVANTQLYILDKYLQPLPVGIPGELFIGGVQLARGYRNLPALTAERFITHQLPGGMPVRLYRTGDLVKWLPDGNIAYLGRLDEQVKIRGYRIEPGEIENVLLLCPGIKQAAVKVWEDHTGNRRLVGYLVTEATLDAAVVQQFLQSRLPDYMIPALWVEMGNMPLSGSGKVNKKALPAPENTLTYEQAYVAPRNEIEAQLSALWGRLLGVKQVGVYDNFFRLGGHSLLIIRLVALIREELHLTLSIKTIFEYPDIQSLATVLRSEQAMAPAQVIPVRPANMPVPLSFSQERLWFIDRLQGSIPYHMPYVLRLKGALNITALENAFQAVADRHDILRTLIREQDTVAFQEIREKGWWKMEPLLVKDPEDAHLQAYILSCITRPFDLTLHSPLRAQLISLSATEYLLVVVMHHIASDAASVSLLIQELAAFYNEQQEQRVPVLPELSIQYADYAFWQRNAQQEQMTKELSYWKKQLAEVPVLEMPTDFPRQVMLDTAGAQAELLLPKALGQQLEALAQAEGVTLYMVLLSAFNVLLYRYSGQTDICVGTPVAGRGDSLLEPLIGFFVNTLAIRIDISGNPNFRTVLKRVKTCAIDAYSHQSVPFERIVDAVGVPRDMSHHPIFQVMFSFHSGEEDQLPALGELVVSSEIIDHHAVKFDLLIDINEEADGLRVSIEYSTALFKEARITRMLHHLANILEAVGRDAEQPVNTVSYLGDDEVKELLTYAGDHTKEDISHSVTSLLAAVVKEHSGLPALSDGIVTYNYRELWEQSGLISGYLQQICHVQEESLVGIVMSRGTGFVLSMTGVLRSGAAYLPIESHQPVERIRRLLQEGGVSVVLTDNDSMASALGAHFTCVDLQEALAAGITTSGATPAGNSLAYVMFTSGSTGEPKGVMVEHRSIVRLVKDTNYVTLSSDDRILQTGALSFDAATFEIWGALLNGGLVYITSLESLLDTSGLREQISRFGITKMWFTSSWFNQLADHAADLFCGLEQILVGGERLSPVHISKVQQHCPGLRITNGYGPTENTTFSVCGDVTVEDIHSGEIKLGIPVSKSQVYIVDKQYQLVAKGVYGELLLGGEGVSRGYINDEERTSRSFIDSPFMEGERLYRSGDIGCWDEGGRIIFRGRADGQVKIRGFRVEPLEVATALRGHELVKDAIVTVHISNSGDKQLAAYYTGEAGIESLLRNWLKEQLPVYMIPSSLQWLPAFELNANGKTDQKQLPPPQWQQEGYEAATGDMEKYLVDLWSELLGIPGASLSVLSNFFELGGQSLKAIVLMGRISRDHGVKVPLPVLFSHATIRSLAGYISTHHVTAYEGLTHAAAAAAYPLSSAQRRMYLLQQFDPAGTAYNIPLQLPLPDNCSQQRVAAALQELINRHESLRTRFEEQEGVVMQVIADEVILEVESLSSPSLSSFVRSFDLSQAPLLRAGYYEGLLLLDMHHIITDGLSQAILQQEFMVLLDGGTLPPVTFQYKDYASWEQSAGEQSRLQAHAAYWGERMGGELPVLDLPLDYPRPDIRQQSGSAVSLTLTATETNFIRTLCRQEEATLYMVGLSLWQLLLWRISGQEDIIVGTPVSGRQHADLSGIVGLFVNTLAIRGRVQGSQRYTAFLSALKKEVLRDFEHQSYPFEALLEQVWHHRDTSRHPLFDSLFSVQNREAFWQETWLHDVAEPVEEGSLRDGKFDLNLRITEYGDGLHLHLGYNTSLFEEHTATAILKGFSGLLAGLQAHGTSQYLFELPLLQERPASWQLQESGGLFALPEQTYSECFEAQVLRSPSSTALQDEQGTLSYVALNAWSNQLARRLSGSGKVIGVLLPACKEIMVAIIGIFKAGAAYLPIDTSAPAHRISHILSDSGVDCVVTMGALPEDIVYSGTVIDLNSDFVKAANTANLQLPQYPGQPAYIIYTSGSTGKPKGVPIQQGSLMNYVNWFISEVDYNANDATILTSSYSFDLGHTVLFPVLLTGGTLHIVSKELYLSGHALGNYIREQGITFVKFTPTLFSMLLNSPGYDDNWLEGVRLLMLGGEMINAADAGRFLERYPDKFIINSYGPAEATAGSVFKRIDAGNIGSFRRRAVIGRPIRHMQAYILDKHQHLQPDGITGEIYLSGIGLSEGYYQRADLTAERFIASPFAAGERLYATGDIGKWTAEGDLVCLGRRDHQVKIRGYRVELPEIEQQLQHSGLVQECCVVAREDSAGDLFLAAFVTGVEESGIPAL